MQVVCRHPRRLFQWKGLRLMWCDMCVRFGATCGAVFVLVCLLWFHQHNTKMKPKLQNLWIKLRIFRRWYSLIVGFYWYSIRNIYVMITLDAENSSSHTTCPFMNLIPMLYFVRPWLFNGLLGSKWWRDCVDLSTYYSCYNTANWERELPRELRAEWSNITRIPTCPCYLQLSLCVREYNPGLNVERKGQTGHNRCKKINK